MIQNVFGAACEINFRGATMKNPFKDFTIPKTLKLLSVDGIYEVCGYFDFEFITKHAELRNKKSKTLLQEAAHAFLTSTQDIEHKAYSLLRVGYFFHQQRKAVPNLIKYVTSKGCTIDQDMLKFCNTEAEQVIRLGILYPVPVHEYFIISLHTSPSKRYWQRRYYSGENFPADQTIFDALRDEVKDILVAQGRGHACQMTQFEHEGKRYLIMDLQDSPTASREWEQDKIVERFTKPVMEIVFLLDAKAHSVDVMAEDTAMRSAMHQACASVLFGKNVESKPKDNEIYDLEALQKLVAGNQPLSVTYPQQYKVEKIFPQAIRITRQNFPYWENTLNLRLSKKSILEKDHSGDMHRMLKTIVWLDNPDKGFWQLNGIKITHAEMVAVYWDDFEQQRISKTFTINSKGESNLHHEPEDEEIRRFLRGADILKERMELPLPGSIGQSVFVHVTAPAP